MNIPRIIHQTWRTDTVPEAFAGYVESWRANHPSWEYRLWNDKDNRKLVEAHYDWFLEQYDSYPLPIQRADAARYMILHQYGGLYVDLDFRSLRPLDPLLGGRSCVFGLEPEAHCRQFGLPKIICNALIAAKPRHSFLAAVIHRLREFAVRIDGQQPVLESTGPFMLNRVYDEYSGPDDVSLLPAKYLYPLTMKQADELQRTGCTDGDLSEAFAVHFHAGTWWRPHANRAVRRFRWAIS
jgi:mannosyltransferase OCH1-like enzyme